MNLIITINNAQMIIEKENLGKNEIKWREENTCIVTVKIQLTSSKNKKKTNLEQEKSFQDTDPRRASERFLTGFDTREQPITVRFRSNVVQWLQSSFDFSNLLVGTELKIAAQGKAPSLPPLTACRSKQITSKTTLQRDKLLNFNTQIQPRHCEFNSAPWRSERGINRQLPRGRHFED